MRRAMLLTFALLFSCAYPVGETPPPPTVRRFSLDKIRSTVYRQGAVIRNDSPSPADISLSVLRMQIQQLKNPRVSRSVEITNIQKLLQK